VVAEAEAAVPPFQTAVHKATKRVSYLESRLLLGVGVEPDVKGDALENAWYKQWTATAPTTQDLRDAEQRLRDAKQDLRDAEQRLRDAKQELASRKVSAAEIVQNSPYFLRTLGDESLCYGRADFSRSILRVAKDVEGSLKTNPILQKTSSLVLRSAGGVGKTFATLAFRKVAMGLTAECAGWVPFTCYLGMNSDWPLAAHEVNFLIQSVGKEHSVMAVLCIRLLVALHVQLADFFSPDPACRGSLAHLDKKDHASQRIVLPVAAKGILESHISEEWLKRADILDVQCTIVQLLNDAVFLLPANQRFCILVAVDEAQFLDSHIPPTGDDAGGARLALRALRQLQLQVAQATNCRAILLPIATGINPVTVLSTNTTGRQVVIGATGDEAHMSLTDFIAYHKSKAPQRTYGTYPFTELGARLLYPFARDVESLPRDPTISWTPLVETPSILNARDVATSAFTKVPMPAKDVPTWIPVVPSKFDGTVVPIIPYTVWGHLCTCTMSPTLRLSLNVVQSCRSPSTWSDFESLVFEVLGMFMFWFAPQVHLNGAKSAVRQVMSPGLKDWLPCFELVSMTQLDRHMHQHNPHSSLGTHDVVRNTGGLSPDFAEEVSALMVGQGSWFRCGGNAAIDFILVVRSEDAKYSIRFLDAKHTTSKASTPILLSIIKEIVAKAVLEHAAIARKLTTHFEKLGRGTVSVEPFDNCHALVITNDAALRPPNNALTPNNFNWEPWTGILFHCSTLVKP
jgi:hypothetical protein